MAPFKNSSRSKSSKALPKRSNTPKPKQPYEKARKETTNKKKSTAPYTSKQVAQFYYKNVENIEGNVTAYYKCRCGVQRKMEANTGYTNLLQHVFMWHSNFLLEMANAGNNSGTLVGYIDDKSFKIYSWIDMTISCNLPFTFCES